MLEPTPTLDPTLPRRYADFDTVIEALEYAARGLRGLNFYSPRGELETSIKYSQIRDRAHEIGRRLVHFGIEKNSRVALIAETNEDFVCYFIGCQYAGLLPVPLPLPTSFGGRDGYTEQLHQQMKSCKASVALSAAYMLPLLDEATNGLDMLYVGTPDAFEAQASKKDIKNVSLPEVKTDDLAYLQYSSGSTRFPHGVAVTHKSLMSNCYGIGKIGMDVVDNDRAISWLPFYHDMGLVGMLVSPIACQVSIDYLATEAFARRPIQWLKLISKNKGTMCSGPTFGYEICARRANKTDIEGLDLSSWRVAGIGADMIRPNVLEMFAETFKDCGFDKRAFMPSYGLAECTLAVSFAPKFTGYNVDLVSEDVLNGNVNSIKDHKSNGTDKDHKSNGTDVGTNYREVVNCGVPLPEYDLEIRDENNTALNEREIGRVCLKGPSVMVGYYMDQEATDQCLSKDGWLDTGDIGYMAKGSLYIIGRIKDLIIINGKNHWPHDIEWAVEKLPEFRSGDSAAISIPGENDEEVPAILVQCRKRGEEERIELENRIKTEVQAVIGKVPVVILVPPRSLPRTSSGKLSRVKARRQYLEGTLT